MFITLHTDVSSNNIGNMRQDASIRIVICMFAWLFKEINYSFLGVSISEQVLKSIKCIRCEVFRDL